MKKEKKNVFITGATGLLGRFLIKALLDNGYRIFALARSKQEQNARDRVFDALRFVYGKDWNPKFIEDNIRIVEGDTTFPDLGMSRNELDYIEIETDIIIHSAASVELKAPIEINRKINVEGTRGVLEFASRCKENGRLKKIDYISTMYVVGNKAIDFDETMLDVGQDFYNTYEQSKFEAEILVREYLKKGMNISIFRPSMIMGDSKTGKTNNFQHFYQALHYFAGEIFTDYPGNYGTTQNLINVDTVASIIAALLEEEDLIYHVISPNDTNVKFFMELASECLEFKSPNFIPVEEFDFSKLTFVQKTLCEPHLPYFNYKAKFIASRTFNLLQKKNFKCPEIDKRNLMKVFHYCIEKKYIKI